MEQKNNDTTIAFHTILSEQFFNFDPVNERIMFDPCNDYIFKFDTNKRLVKMNLQSWETKEEDYIHTGSSTNPNIVKYSPNEHILCLRTSVHEITFIPRDKNYKPFTYHCNLSNHSDNMIKDIFWPTDMHVFIVMKYGIDIFECNLSDPSSNPLKRIYEININISWFVYNSRILLYFSDDDDKFLNGFHFKKQKDHKIEVKKLETVHIDSEVPLLREDIIISKLYDKIYCIFIDNIKHKLFLFQIRYKAVKPNQKVKSNPIVLNLNVNGPVRLNIVDNLIISHNITKNVSMIYDIKLDSSDKELNYIIDPLPIAAYKDNNYKVIGKYTDCQFIFPETLVNKGNGQIHKIQILLDNISQNISNTSSLMNFLLRRKDGKSVIFNYLKQWTKNRSNFNDISKAFFLINNVLSSFEKSCSKSRNIPDRSIEVAKEKIIQFWSSEDNEKDTYSLLNSVNKDKNIYYKGHIVISQDEMYTELFVPMEEELKDHKYKVAIVSEYIKHLNFSQIKVHSFIYELIIDILVRNNRFYQLHQLLQYYVINDSQHVACQLLYIEQKYPPALQLALDMLKRLNEPSQIIEVLFTKGMVLTALKYLNSLPDKSLLRPLAPRFLEEAKKMNDLTLFHITYNYFKSMNFIDSSFNEYDEYYNNECKAMTDDEVK